MQIEIYVDKASEWRWRFRADNGNIVGDSSEGYKNKGDMMAELLQIRTKARTAPIIDVES